MRWRCTVVRPDGTRTDLEVHARRSTPVGHVVPLVGAATATAPDRLRVAGRALDDHLQLGLPPLVQGAVLTAAPDPAGSQVDPDPLQARTGHKRDGLVELRVVGGPDGGAGHRLGPGVHRVGRAPGCEVRVEDATCSRVHALVDVTDGGVEVRDAGSTNGTTVDGRAVTAAPPDEAGRDAAATGTQERGTPLPPGARLRVGDTTLQLHAVVDDPAPLRRCGDGTLALRRSARVPVSVRDRVVAVPEAPAEPGRPRVPWLGAALPLLVSVPLAFWWGPVALLIGLTGPLVVLGSAWNDRRVARAEHRVALADHAAAAHRSELATATAVRDELAERREAAPDPGAVGRWAAGRERRTWERGRHDSDTLVLRLGTGRVAARTRRRPGGDDDGGLLLDDAPVTAGLPDVGVLGVTGPDASRRALLRWLVGQVAVLHSPADVRLHVVAPGTPGWSWTGWLPHVSAPAGAGCAATVAADLAQARRRIDELAQVVRRRGPDAPAAAEPWVVLLLDGARRLGDVPGLSTVLTAGPAAGVLTVCGDASPAGLPSECGAVACLDTAGRLLLRVHGEPDHEAVVPDGVGPSWCEATARGLAPLRDETGGGATGSLPASVHLVDLHARTGLDATDPRALANAWTVRRRSTRVILGSTASGDWTVDLRTDGPHALVGGTTGAGKSELLQSLVVSLAVANHPEEMSFVLVDFKGGAAFGACADLPHTAGLVTDLDAHLTARALESLGAEVRRRERVLAAAGAADLDAYQARTATGATAGLPRLVIVVDEYRALAEELPDLMDSLVRLAAVGRSLGIHLVLATQRPAGVVGADLRANVNLRIALRVRDAADSVDVVESPDAAGLDPAAPGRALARTGGGPLLPVQVARVAGSAPRDDRSVTVRRLGWDALGDPPDGGARPGPVGPRPAVDPGAGGSEQRTTQRPEHRTEHRTEHSSEHRSEQGTGAPGGDGPAPKPATDLASIVAALRAAAGLVSARPPAGPWLPPLPDHVPWPGSTATRVPRPAEPSGRPAATTQAGLARAAPVLTVGVVDVPAEQTREPLVWDLGAGCGLVVAGAPRSGRSGVVRAVLAAVAEVPACAVHVHLVTGGGPPAGVDTLPHVGTVVGADEPARVTRLLERLAEEVARRRAAPPEEDTGPTVLLVVDGAEQVVPALDGHDGGRGLDLLLDVMRGGPGAGVLTLLVGDRSVLSGRLSGTTAQRWVLRLADPTDLLLAGVPARSLPTRQPPGRLLRLGPDGVHEAQVAAVDDAVLAAAVTATVARDERVGTPRVQPFRVERLPDRLPLTRLLRLDAGAGRHRTDAALSEVALGCGGPDAAPVGLDLRAAAALVAGAAGSGRTTVLDVTAAVVLDRGGRVVAVRPRARPSARPPTRPPTRPRTGPSAGRGSYVELDGSDPAALRDAVDARHGATLVLVDDVSLVHDLPAEDALLAVCDTWDRTGSGMVVAGSTSSLAGRYRGLAALARRSGCGVLLGTLGPADGDLLSVALPRATPGPPGRGLLVRAGVVHRLQVADPGVGAEAPQEP